MAGSEKISGTKISCCNHRWSEPKGFKTWLIFNLLQLLLFQLSNSENSEKTKKKGEKCVCAVEKCWWVLLFAKGKKCVLVVCKFSKLHSKNVALKNLRWHWIFNYRFTSLLAIFQSTFNRMLRAAKTNRIFFKLVLSSI